MKILILEDDKNRIEVFKKNLSIHELDFCTRAMEAVNLVTNIKYDWIFLDHDLEGKPYEDSDYENTGYQVAKMIPLTLNRNTRITIHSMNPVGAEQMVRVIGPNAERIPFCCVNWKDGNEN